MPIDPNIILGIRQAQISQQDPLSQFAKATALKQSMTAGDVQALQAQQARQSMSDEEAVRGAFRQSGGDNARLRALLTEGGQYKQLQALDAAELARREKESVIGKNTAATEKSKYDVAIDGIQRRASVLSLANPQNWSQVRRQIAMENPQAAAAMPEQFDPTFVQMQIAQGQTIAQRLADQRARETQQNVIRGQDMTAATARRGQDITARGQNMTDARARETLTAGRWQNDLDRGIQINMATGETRPITQGGAPIDLKAGKPTDTQNISAGYASRMANSERIISDLERQSPEIGKPGLTETTLRGLPGESGKMSSNLAMSKDRQSYRQAQEDWVRAKLRKESGAVIADEEMDREIRVYFPQIGDDPATVKQKADSRKVAERSMVQSAGSAKVDGGGFPDLSAIDAEIERRKKAKK